MAKRTLQDIIRERQAQACTAEGVIEAAQTVVAQPDNGSARAAFQWRLTKYQELARAEGRAPHIDHAAVYEAQRLVQLFTFIKQTN